MKNRIELTIEHKDPYTVELTNGNGDTFTYNPQKYEGLEDFLNGAKILTITAVVGRSEQLKAFEQGETLFLDNTLKVEVITPESSVLVKDSRDNKMMWVEKDRLKRH